MSTRRQFMIATGAGSVAVPLLAHASPVGAASYEGNTLVVMFMRGGCDGLSILAPVGNSDYHDARPTIAIPEAAALPLTGPAARSDFGWHPGAARLAQLYGGGRVAVVPAAGSPDHSRSHFDCQDGIEAGRPEDRRSVQGGWLGRFLAVTAVDDHPLRAFTAGTGLPASLRGYGAISAPTLDQLGLISWGPDPLWAKAAIAAGYDAARAGPQLATWAGVTLGALDEVAPLIEEEHDPPEGWPDTQVGTGLFTIARLVESGLPVQVATVDLGGWDHHDDMGSATNVNGRTSRQVATLDGAVGAFFDRLEDSGLASRVTLVTMTEFGRRVAQNDSGGLDHGWGSQMLIVGGGVSPGVHGPWPGLAPGSLNGGDLAMTVDQRSVLSELLVRRLGASELTTVFPGFDTAANKWAGVTA